MATASNMNELVKIAQQMINKALETNVAEISKQTMQERIQEDVYNAYTPYSIDGETPHYERTGGLLKDVEVTLIGDTLVLEDTRKDEETGRDIVQVIEDGKGYTWGYKRNLDEEIGARPFVENTYNDLAGGLAKNALAEGLRKQGLTVE